MGTLGSVLVSGIGPSLSPGLCVFQEVKQYYEDYQQMKQQQREEAKAEQEVAPSKCFLHHLRHWQLDFRFIIPIK